MKIETAQTYNFTSESCHLDNPIEWWFIQGEYKLSDSDVRYFMLSLFRHKIDLNGSNSSHAFSFLLSIFDPQAKQPYIISQIEPNIINLINNFVDFYGKFNIDRSFLKAYIDEVVKYGPLKPIVCLGGVDFKLSPFNFSWQDFYLGFLDDRISVRFKDPQTQKICEFQLVAGNSQVHMSEFDMPYAAKMDYLIYPALCLKGNLGSQSITGRAWFEHQWGNIEGWFVSDISKAKILGWDWMAINLSDNRNLLVMVHRDMKTKKIIYKYVLAVEPAKPAYLIKDFIIKPARYWQSRVTRINYPVEWDIVIPEIKAELKFKPLEDNQEIPIFGISRAIWEGAGKISGKIGKEEVSCASRLELNGYGYVFDYRGYLKQVAGRVDKHIEEFFPKKIGQDKLVEYVGLPHWRHEPQAYTKTISQPIWDLMGRKGKHWRPIFSLLLMESLGIDSQKYEKLTSVISELSHTGALIIDDIEDNSKLRRSQECIHLKYGMDIAINAANTIYFLPYLLLSGHKDLTSNQSLELHKIMIRQFVQAHFGQALDIYWSRHGNLKNLKKWAGRSFGEKILQMYDYKTAAAVLGISEVVAVIGNVDEKVKNACLELGRAFGVSFQVIDDVLNFSGSVKWTKTCGEDLIEGKLTYVINKSLELLKGKEKNRLAQILCSKELRSNKKSLQEGINLVRNSGALGVCKKEAYDMIASQWHNFSLIVPPSEPKLMLKMLCFSLLNIAYEV